jgi:ribosomal protein S12 methylthiotransferase accessory factor
VRGVADIPLEPDDPRLFHAATETADCEPLFGRRSLGQNGGCGLTREIAWASAIGEAIERYAAAAYDESALISATYRDLRGHGIDAVPPESIPLYSQRQYETPGFPYLPFHEDTRLKWTWGTSLVSGRRLLVPACLVFIPFQEDARIADAVSTGLACDISTDGAALSGLYEVIERDAIMIMWLGELPAPRIETEALNSVGPIFDEIFRPSGLEFWLSDISSDLALPVVFALAIDRENAGLALTVGAAAGLTFERAALKALVEAAQGRVWLKYEYEAGRLATILARHEVATFHDHVRWFGHREQLSHVDFLLGSKTTTQATRSSVAGEEGDGDSHEDQLGRSVTHLAQLGLDVIMVDLTPPDIKALGFEVVKILVPGLVDLNAHHLLPFKGNTRLYTVPERLGYRRALSEDELNDVPHPFP